MIIRSRVIAAMLAIVPSFVGGPLLAQDSTAAQREETCRRYAEAGKLDPRRSRPTTVYPGMISVCGGAAGVVLADLWRTPPTDSISLSDIIQGSVQVLDERILQATMAAVQNRALQRNVRLAALRVVWFYTPYRDGGRNGVIFGGLRITRNLGDSSVVWGESYNHFSAPVEGTQPIVGDISRRVIPWARVVMEEPDQDLFIRLALRDFLKDH